MNWVQVRVLVDGEAAEAVAEALRPFAFGGVSLEQAVVEDLPDQAADLDSGVIVPHLDDQVTVSVFFPEDQDSSAVRSRIQHVLWHMGQLYPIPEPSFGIIREQDWANTWKEHYAPIRIGQRILVCPAWEKPDAQPGDILLLIDPGMAFGTGLHPTTRMCLEIVEELARPGTSVLDMGTGSGILAVAAALLGAGPILAVDRDPEAVQAAQHNSAINGVADAVKIQEGSLTQLQAGKSWDLILVNILAPVILRFFQEGLTQYLGPGGVLVLAGLIEEQALEVLAAMEQCGVSLIERRQVRDWVTLIGRR